tara:strand:- start:2047 stop:2202 length:156 start_codon:yes stop_codon:yes gene_type:complete
MAKTKKIEEAVEEAVQVEETVQETVVEETPKVPQGEDGITDRAYTSLKYKK